MELLITLQTILLYKIPTGTSVPDFGTWFFNILGFLLWILLSIYIPWIQSNFFEVQRDSCSGVDKDPNKILQF